MGKVTQEIAEVFLDPSATARVTQEIAEVFLTPITSGRVSQTLAEIFIKFDQASVSLPSITGTVGDLLTFAPAVAAGSVEAYSWLWQSVPGGSSIINQNPEPLPDLGATSWTSMTSNAVLFHCENNSLDSSGNSNNLTLSSVTYSSGKIGSGGFDFTASTNSQAILSSTVPTAGDYSACFWFYNLKSNTNWRTGLRSSSGAGHPIIVQTGTDNLGVYNGSFYDCGFDMPSASYTGWHHIAIVAKTSTGNTDFYVDGVFVGTAATKVTDPIQCIGNLQSGFGGNQVFADRLDEIAIWTRELSAGEINLIYRIQSLGYAGYSSTLTFSPDAAGTYSIDLYFVDSVFKTTGMVSANAVIAAAPTPEPPSPVPSTVQMFIPNKSGYGVEIRYGRDIKKRNNLAFISSGQWIEMGDDGLIDQEVSPLVLGELIDPVNYYPFDEQHGFLTPAEILESDILVVSDTIDYQEGTDKDGRITVFFPSARSYVVKEETPFQSRGFKAENETILGYSTGIIFDPFFDGGESSLGITKEGYYGTAAEVKMTFIDRVLTDGLGFVIDNDDFDSDYQTGAFGTSLYSSEFGTDSIAYAGMMK